MKIGRFAATAAAATVVLVLVVPAAPAWAVNPTTSISSPGNGAVLSNSTVAINGTAAMQQPSLGLGTSPITGVSLNVTFGGSTAASCSNNGCGATLGGPSTSFSYSPSLARNGPYVATVNVTATESMILGSTARSASATASFKVGALPAAPHGVTAQANADRSVTVSWSRNSEPDILGYQIQRQDPGGSLTSVANISQPGGSPVTWTDPVPSQAGGTFGYAVIAVRPGADGPGSAPVSKASTVTSVNVPPPPPPPTTTTVPSTDGSTPPTITIPPPISVTPVGPAGTPTLDLSNFLNSATGKNTVNIPAGNSKLVLPSSGSPRLGLPSLEPPDTGFGMTLPFGQAPKLATPKGGNGDQLAVGSPSTSGSPGRTLLLPFAAGLFLCVAGLHLRFYNRHLGAGALEPLVPLAAGDDPSAVPGAGVPPGTGLSGVGQRVAGWASSVRTTAGPKVSAAASSVGSMADKARDLLLSLRSRLRKR